MASVIPPPTIRRRSLTGSSLGGLTTAARMTPDQRIERASKAGNTVLRAYGQDYYVAMGRTARKCRA